MSPPLAKRNFVSLFERGGNMGEVFVALGGADLLQRAAVAPDWRVGDVREIRQNGIGFYGKFFRMTAVAARSVEKNKKKR